MTTDELRALHSRVWQFRKEAHEWWPTPCTMDAIRFAATEALEAMDAWLRIRGGYARNNHKEPDVYGELADCALMLLTTLGPDCAKFADCYDVPADMDTIAFEIAYAMQSLHDESGRSSQWIDTIIVGTLYAISRYPGMYLDTELERRLDRIRAKHGNGNGG